MNKHKAWLDYFSQFRRGAITREAFEAGWDAALSSIPKPSLKAVPVACEMNHMLRVSKDVTFPGYRSNV